MISFVIISNDTLLLSCLTAICITLANLLKLFVEIMATVKSATACKCLPLSSYCGKVGIGRCTQGLRIFCTGISSSCATMGGRICSILFSAKVEWCLPLFLTSDSEICSVWWFATRVANSNWTVAFALRPRSHLLQQPFERTGVSKCSAVCARGRAHRHSLLPRLSFQTKLLTATFWS